MRKICGIDTSTARPERETRTGSPAVTSCGLYRNSEVVGNVSKKKMSARLCQHKQWYQLATEE